MLFPWKQQKCFSIGKFKVIIFYLLVLIQALITYQTFLFFLIIHKISSMLQTQLCQIKTDRHILQEKFGNVFDSFMCDAHTRSNLFLLYSTYKQVLLHIGPCWFKHIFKNRGVVPDLHPLWNKGIPLEWPTMQSIKIISLMYLHTVAGSASCVLQKYTSLC